MNFGFTEEQNMLREQVRRFMQEACSIARVRELMASDSGFDADLWKQVADLGTNWPLRKRLPTSAGSMPRMASIWPTVLASLAGTCTTTPEGAGRPSGAGSGA